MKKLIIIVMLYTLTLNAQSDAKLIYDQETGNYTIEYQGHPNYGEEEVSSIRRIFEPSTKVLPIVKLNVLFDDKNDVYLYEYEITNSKESAQRLQSFDVEIHSKIQDLNSPNKFWKIGYYSAEPVFGWFNSKGSNGIANPFDGIAPDSTEKGFSFISSGLPTISNAFFKGKSTIYLSFPDEPPNKVTELLKPLRIFPNNSVIQKTIGPKDVQIPFIHLSFLNILISYLESSLELKWIIDQPTHNKYNTYLSNAKTALEQNDTNSARFHLQNIITDVDIDSSSTLTSEAYALLKFNTEYLLEKLPMTNIGDMFDILINHINNCYEKKWIDNKGIFNSLIKKIGNAKKQYEKGKIKTANNKLNAFNKELEAQKGKHLNDSCYNLLFHYSNLIIEKLK